MSTADIERLLREAAESSIGPLSLVLESKDDESWTMAASWYNSEPARIAVIYDAQTEGARLERSVQTTAAGDAWRAIILAKPWVMDAAQVPDGGLAVRLWLHGKDLDVNTVLAAICDLTRLSELLPDRAPNEAAPVAAPPPPPAPPAVDTATVTESTPPLIAAEVTATSETPPVAGDTPASEPASLPEVAAEPAAAPPPAAVVKAARPAPKPMPWEILTAPAKPAEPAAPAPVSVEAAAEPPVPPAEAALAAGAAPEEPAPQPVGHAGYCKECGSAHRPDHVFCVNCGARLN